MLRSLWRGVMVSRGDRDAGAAGVSVVVVGEVFVCASDAVEVAFTSHCRGCIHLVATCRPLMPTSRPRRLRCGGTVAGYGLGGLVVKTWKVVRHISAEGLWRGGEVVGAGAAAGFGSVHGVVGAPQDVVGGAGVAGWDQDDADAGPDVQVVSGDGNRSGECGMECVGDVGECVYVVELYGHEFVAAEASEGRGGR